MATESPLVMGSISPEIALEILRGSMERMTGEHFEGHRPPDMAFVVWSWAQDASRSPIPRCERVSLRGLAACAGGWLTQDPGTSDMVFIALPQWLRAYNSWKETAGDRLVELGQPGAGSTRLVVPVSPGQAARLVRAKLYPLLDEMLLDFWQAKLSGTTGGAEVLGEAIRVITSLHEEVGPEQDQLLEPDSSHRWERREPSSYLQGQCAAHPSHCAHSSAGPQS